MNSELKSYTLPDGQRERLLHWMRGEEFETILRICRQRVAAAVLEYAKTVQKHPDQVLNVGAATPGLDSVARKAAEWTLVYAKLRELQADISNLEKAILVGSQLEI